MGNTSAKPGDGSPEEVYLGHFRLLRCVGRGAFGKVRMVEHKQTKKLYALKYINKKDCIKMEALRNVFRERNLLERVDHPYICNLRFAFQDDEYMYMVLDLMMGGDLRFHLDRRSFDESVIRLWFAELSSALGYLHCKLIVHRDIKPDNILLDERGHVHLTDFNIATQFEASRPLISESGTCVYMAPEMFRGKGYAYQVDWWALGIVLYECLYGHRPFDGDSSDVVKWKIQNEPIHYPARMRHESAYISNGCMQVLQGWLDRDPERRLCCTLNVHALSNSRKSQEEEQSWTVLMRMSWFERIPWHLVEVKQAPALFVPSGDRNFDAVHDLQEMLLEEEPLEGKGRRKGTRPTGKYAKELELIERKFKSFDYLLYETYDPIVDPVKMTVSDPPNWVKCVDKETPPPSIHNHVSSLRTQQSEKSIHTPPRTSSVLGAPRLEQREIKRHQSLRAQASPRFAQQQSLESDSNSMASSNVRPAEKKRNSLQRLFSHRTTVSNTTDASINPTLPNNPSQYESPAAPPASILSSPLSPLSPSLSVERYSEEVNRMAFSYPPPGSTPPSSFGASNAGSVSPATDKGNGLPRHTVMDFYGGIVINEEEEEDEEEEEEDEHIPLDDITETQELKIRRQEEFLAALYLEQQSGNSMLKVAGTDWDSIPMTPANHGTSNVGVSTTASMVDSHGFYAGGGRDMSGWV